MFWKIWKWHDLWWAFALNPEASFKLSNSRHVPLQFFSTTLKTKQKVSFFYIKPGRHAFEVKSFHQIPWEFLWISVFLLLAWCCLSWKVNFLWTITCVKGVRTRRQLLVRYTKNALRFGHKCAGRRWFILWTPCFELTPGFSIAKYSTQVWLLSGDSGRSNF